ncbi:MAG: hypothetical protein OSJ34_05250 [Muribaculaceae bacterium]|nr:hypothetical protein [Muribaculaceae bacterium]
MTTLMAQEVTKFSTGAEREDKPHGYGRFWAAFRQLTLHADPEECRREFVRQFTNDRTDSLKEMRRGEYNTLCAAIEGLNQDRNELRSRRSTVLKLLQELEVDTTDWAQINDFCRHPRIAGKEFGRLSVDELTDLAKKLRSIKRKGWVRRSPWSTPPPAKHHIAYLINLTGIPSFKNN